MGVGVSHGQRVDSGCRGQGRGWGYFMGTELQFGGMEKIWMWTVGTAAQQCECA